MSAPESPINHEGSTHGEARAQTGVADVVILNTQIVTVDSNDTVIDSGAIAISGGVISYAGPSAGAPPAAKTIDASGAISLPGLVNTHAHLAMTLLRGIADERDLDAFLGRLIPIETAVADAHFVELGTELAAAECVQSGVTTALDMYFFPERARLGAGRIGLRLLNGPIFIEFPGPENMDFAARLAYGEQLLTEAAALGSPIWVSPHSAYLLSEPQLVQVAELANKFNARVHVHAAETKAELSQVAQRHGGRTPVQVLSDCGLLHDRTVLAHAVHLSDTDISMVASVGAHIAHNPASNQKLSSGFAPIERYLDAGINVALGTDGSCSANDLDLWMAMRLASYARKVATGDASLIPAKTVVRMATSNGARLCGLADSGSIEVGKRADVVVLRANELATTPSYDPWSTLAYAVSRREVGDVFVDGRHVVASGDITADKADLIRRLEPQIARVRSLL